MEALLRVSSLTRYTDLFEGAAGEDGAISLNQLQDWDIVSCADRCQVATTTSWKEFLQQHKMAISEERLTSIMKEAGVYQR